MSFQGLIARRRGALAIAAVLAGGALATVTLGSFVAAQDAAPEGPKADAPAAKEPDAVAKVKRRHVVRKTRPAMEARSAAEVKSPTETKTEAKTTAPPAEAHEASAQGKAPAPPVFTAQLDKAGASACRGQVNALATSTMGSVVRYNTVSNWSQVGGDKRAVSLAIGQKYADGSAVPFSVSEVISAPNQQGACDSFTVQVFPSPLPCGKLRDSRTAAHGQLLGDLAGIPLMQDAVGRTMLVPTAAQTCVLVTTRTVYAK